MTNGYVRDYTNMDFLKFTPRPRRMRAARARGEEPDLLALVRADAVLGPLQPRLPQHAADLQL